MQSSDRISSSGGFPSVYLWLQTLSRAAVELWSRYVHVLRLQWHGADIYFQHQVCELFRLEGAFEDVHTGCPEHTNHRAVSAGRILVGSFDRLLRRGHV